MHRVILFGFKKKMSLIFIGISGKIKKKLPPTPQKWGSGITAGKRHFVICPLYCLSYKNNTFQKYY